MKNSNLPQTLVAILIFVFSLTIYGSPSNNENVQELSYEDILKELSSPSNSIKTKNSYQSKDPFENVKIHLGVGLVSSVVSVTNAPHLKTIWKNSDGELIEELPTDEEELKTISKEIVADKSQNFGAYPDGIQLSLGIDLFSDNWYAEGSLRSYNDASFSGGTLSLKEFDLKIVYQTSSTSGLRYKFGSGLSARYLDIYYTINGKTYEYSTPSSILLTGIESKLTNLVGISLELSKRTSLIGETTDSGAIDFLVRLDSHF